MHKPLDLNSENLVIELNNMLQDYGNRAKGNVSFWGSRTVELQFIVKKESGDLGGIICDTTFLESQVVSLDEIARKVLFAKYQFGHTSFNDYRARMEVIKRLDGFYKESDIVVKNSGFITRILTWIRDFVFLGSSARNDVERSLKRVIALENVDENNHQKKLFL